MINIYVEDYEEDRIMALSKEAIDLYKKKTGKVIEDAYFLYRDNVDLINIVKELGTDKASGKGSLLKIFEVPDNTIGIVYNPMKIKLSLTNDAKDLFKQLSGKNFTEDIPRHNEYLVKTIQKLGDRASCYPMHMIDIEYIPKDYVCHYEIDRTNGFEKVQLLKGG